METALHRIVVVGGGAGGPDRRHPDALLAELPIQRTGQPHLRELRGRIDGLVRQPGAPVAIGQRFQRPSTKISRNRRFRQIEHRGHDVRLLDEIGDPPSGVHAARLLDDQRHVDRFVIDEQPVLLFAVIAQPFAVIRHEHDRRLIVELVRFEEADEAADDFVGVGDGAVVRSHRHGRSIPGWRREATV